MSWSLSVTGIEDPEEITDALGVKFRETYSEPAEGVREQAEGAAEGAENLAYAVFDGEGPFNVQASGHAKNDDADSFVSVIVTKVEADEAADTAEQPTEAATA